MKVNVTPDAYTVSALTPVQVTALTIYVFDPIFTDDPAVDGDGPFPGTWDGRAVQVKRADLDAAIEWLNDAANSADDDKDRGCRDGLTRMAQGLRAAAKDAKVTT